MKYELLALDIDGTILTSKGELSPRTRRVIGKLKEQGVLVVLATGRRLANTLPWAQALELKTPLIVHNGAVVYDQVTEETIWQGGIELALAREILDKLVASDLNYVIYTGESGGEEVVAPTGRWREPENLLSHYLGESAEFLPEYSLTEAPIRFALIDGFAKIDPFYDHLLDMYGDRLNIMLFGAQRDTWRGIEIMGATNNKGVGLAQLCQKLGVEQNRVMAIGDNVNDIEMLEWAGLGVAMENGSPLVKAKADLIAQSNDEDGVAIILDELLL